MNETGPQFHPAGDTGLVIDFGEVIDRRISARVLALGQRLRDAAPPGLVEMVPTFRSLLIHLDPDVTDPARMRAIVEPLLDGLDTVPAPARLWRFPVCYDGDMAPDLEDVASRTGQTPDQVVAMHGAVTYHVYMLGFLPGFPYLGDLPEALRLPRRDEPRLRVPAGSIAIATGLTAIYPVQSPGGWHLIGRTPVGLFDTGRDRPALLRPGDKIVFEPVGADDYAELETRIAEGSYAPESTEAEP